MRSGKNLNKSEIITIAEGLEGKKISDFSGVLENSKGAIGHAIETKFGLKINSRAEADFSDTGIELKTNPLKVNKDNTLSAKERLVLNIINYMEENWEAFYYSSFWKKNKNLLILFYIYSKNIPKNEYTIFKSLLFDFPDEDLDVIMDDWQVIADKVKKGLAHQISEADTMYLGACTKGANNKTLRNQPYSSIKAKQRAYSLKTTYMTQLVRTKYGNVPIEKLIKYNEKQRFHFDVYIKDLVKPYLGMYRKDLLSKFSLTNHAKNINELLFSKMLGLKGKVSKSDEFLKAKIIPKTVRIEKNGNIKESMSFPTFKYTDIIKEKWENSNLREMFETTKFMFVVFEHDGFDYRFKKIKLWNLPIEILDNEVKNVWDQTVALIRNGLIVKKITNERRTTFFPKSRSNRVSHVRPHAKNSNDTYHLPFPDKLTGETEYTKHCFWLNSSFIKMILGD